MTTVIVNIQTYAELAYKTVQNGQIHIRLILVY